MSNGVAVPWTKTYVVICVCPDCGRVVSKVYLQQQPAAGDLIECRCCLCVFSLGKRENSDGL